LAIHPSNKFISLLTGDHASSSTSRIFLYPFLSAQRAATLWTGSGTWSTVSASLLHVSGPQLIVADLQNRTPSRIRDKAGRQTGRPSASRQTTAASGSLIFGAGQTPFLLKSP
jgi:hypothetical protein